MTKNPLGIEPSQRFLRRFGTRAVGRGNGGGDSGVVVVVDEFEVPAGELREEDFVTAAENDDTATTAFCWQSFLSKHGRRNHHRSDVDPVRVLWLNHYFLLSYEKLPFEAKQLSGALGPTAEDNKDPSRRTDTTDETVLEVQFESVDLEYDFYAYVVGHQPFQQLVSSPPWLLKNVRIVLRGQVLSHAQCEMLAQFRGQLHLYRCTFDGDDKGGATCAFTDGLAHNQGPRELVIHGSLPFGGHNDEEGFGSFAKALGVNTRLKKLGLVNLTCEPKYDWTTFAEAVAANRGLQKLFFRRTLMNHGIWTNLRASCSKQSKEWRRGFKGKCRSMTITF